MDRTAQTAGMLIVGVGLWIALILATFDIGPMAIAIGLVAAGFGLFYSPRITLGSLAIVAVPVIWFFHAI